jgi:hypothetical protein
MTRGISVWSGSLFTKTCAIPLLSVFETSLRNLPANNHQGIDPYLCRFLSLTPDFELEFTRNFKISEKDDYDFGQLTMSIIQTKRLYPSRTAKAKHSPFQHAGVCQLQALKHASEQESMSASRKSGTCEEFVWRFDRN